jgi:hypothetical protein
MCIVNNNTFICLLSSGSLVDVVCVGLLESQHPQEKLRFTSTIISDSDPFEAALEVIQFS